MKKIFLFLILSGLVYSLNGKTQENSETNQVDRRQQIQENRIEQGIESGSLTEQEANQLQKRQEHIEKIEDKVKEDGTVTKNERRRLHKAQDRASKQIYKQKHDKQRRK